MHKPRLVSHGCIFQLGVVRFYSVISPTTTREVESYVVPVLRFSIARRRSLPSPLFLDSHFFHNLLATASESVLQCSAVVFLTKVNEKHCLSFGVVHRYQRHSGPYPLVVSRQVGWTSPQHFMIHPRLASYRWMFWYFAGSCNHK